MSTQLEKLMLDVSERKSRSVDISIHNWRLAEESWRENGFRSRAEANSAKLANCVYELTVSSYDGTTILRAPSIASLIYWARVLRGEYPDSVLKGVEDEDERVELIMLYWRVPPAVAKFILFLYDNPTQLSFLKIFEVVWPGARRDSLLKQYVYKVRKAAGVDAIDSIPRFGIQIGTRFYQKITELLEKKNGLHS